MGSFLAPNTGSGSIRSEQRWRSRRRFLRSDAGRRAWTRGAICLVLLAARRSRAVEPIEIEVRGDAIAVPPKEPSVAGSVIRREQLSSPGVEAGDVLRTQPGVGVFETGGYGAPTSASIRGATSAQTPVYLAGVRLNDDVGGNADLSTVPVWFLNRVEIYRSNAPLAGDQLGLGGAIFFEPRKPAGPEAGAGAMAGSFGAHAFWGRAALGNERASALVGVRQDGARNDYSYLNDGGTRFDPSNQHTSVFSNADTRRWDVWAVGSLRLTERGRAELVLNDVEREQGLQTFALFPTTAARARFARRLGAFTTRVPCAEQGCQLTTTSSLITTHSRYDDPLREVGLGTSRLDVDATRVEDALTLRWTPLRPLSLTPSVRAAIDHLQVAGEGSPVARARRIFSRVALQGEWLAAERVTLRALGSAECHGTALDRPLPWSAPGDSLGPLGGSAVCGQFEPAARAGAELDTAPLTLLATVGRYARVPTLSELYGVSGVVRGNSALVPETGLSLEVGARSSRESSRALAGLSFDVFAFLRSSRDLISYQRSAIGYVRPSNIGAARVAGLELQVAHRPLVWLLFACSATLLDPRDTSSARLKNDRLPYQPQVTLTPRVELSRRFAKTVVSSSKADISYFYEASRFADRAGLIVIPAQTSLEVGGELGFFGDEIALRARVANVLNQARFDLIGYPLPGRAAYLALEMQL
jgi:iron complex outermembrane receptor protein